MRGRRGSDRVREEEEERGGIDTVDREKAGNIVRTHKKIFSKIVE